MTDRGFRILKILMDLADVPVIYLGLLASYHLRFHAGLFDVTKGIPPIEAYQKSFLAIAVLWYALFLFEDIYSMRGRLTLEQFLRVLRTILLASVLILALVFFIRSFEYSRLTVVIGLGVTSIILGLFHLLKRLLFVRLQDLGYGVRRAVLVGAGDPIEKCYERLSRQPDLGFEVIGMVVDEDMEVEGCPKLGTTSEIRQILMDNHVQDVFVAWPEYSAKRVMHVIQTAGMAGITFRVIPDVYSLIASSVHLGELAGLPVINIGLLPIQGTAGQIKHGLDFILSAVGLVLLSPLLLLVAVAVKLESRGPAIYAQERCGLDGRSFTIYKFRSMRVDAESETGPVWASANDPRKTRIGEFIRKYSIDELPQLYNVLRGDMSLVGPRPERPNFVEEFRRRVPDYMLRHNVRTGITGWAQINGMRGQSSIEDRTKYDVWYVENWSLALDLEILLRTLWLVLFKPDGY